MTDDRKTGGPAFPLQSIGPDFAPGYSGMTLRDYFAAQAMQGILAGYWANENISGVSPAMIAEDAYDAADAMLEARKNARGKFGS